VVPAAELVSRIAREYNDAKTRLAGLMQDWA
jgi:hypothetical protein